MINWYIFCFLVGGNLGFAIGLAIKSDWLPATFHALIAGGLICQRVAYRRMT